MQSPGLLGKPGQPYPRLGGRVKRTGASLLRIAYFTGGGPFGLLPLETLASEHDVVAIVMPMGRSPAWRRWASVGARLLGIRRPDEIPAWARDRGVPRLTARSGRDERLALTLQALRPDLICIATFSWILNGDILSIPRLGAVNLHPSLLPRHRGANPYFWTYYHDDRHAGITAHVADEYVDGGPILTQRRIPLPRGWPVHELYLEAARQGADVMRRAVNGIGDGTAAPSPQDETLASRAPRVRPDEAMVDFDNWDVERVWHFLHGLYPRFREPLLDAKGKPVDYRRVLGYDEGPTEGGPGTIEPVASGWKLWCRNGYLHLAGAGERRSALEREQ